MDGSTRSLLRSCTIFRRLTTGAKPEDLLLESRVTTMLKPFSRTSFLSEEAARSLEELVVVVLLIVRLEGEGEAARSGSEREEQLVRSTIPSSQSRAGGGTLHDQ